MKTIKNLVSIVIPVYNAEKYIIETLESAINQTYKNTEIICADDLSTDNSRQIIKEFAKDHRKIKLINLDKNSKTSVARNIAIQNSNGEFILPLDADDLIDPTYIKKAIDIFTANPDVSVIYCRAKRFGSVNKSWKMPKYSKHYMVYQNIVHCSGVFRKSDWGRYNGYNENMKCGLEDWDFWLNFVKNDKIFYRIDEELLHYRVVSNSRTDSALSNSKILTKQIHVNHPEMFTIGRHLLAHIFNLDVLIRSIKLLRRFIFQINFSKNGKIIRLLGVKILNTYK